MALGPGKYDEWCTLVRKGTHAEAVLVVILNGDRGTGFSVQATYPEAPLVLADILESVARQIRKDSEVVEDDS